MTDAHKRAISEGHQRRLKRERNWSGLPAKLYRLSVRARHDQEQASAQAIRYERLRKKAQAKRIQAETDALKLERIVVDLERAASG